MKSANTSIIQPNAVHKILVKISLVLLFTLLFSFVSHAQHHKLIVDVNEAQQCQLCQHNIDTPPEFVIFSAIAQSTSLKNYSLLPQLHLSWNVYLIPELRAPPVQQ
jgi:hypothetical protein